MKNLIIISFLLLGSCSVSIETPEDVSRYFFPQKWQGYYTRVSGDDGLPEEFKVSNKYMSYKDTSRYADEDEFYTYQIETIQESSSTIFNFERKNAYDDSGLTAARYIFEKNIEQITVKKYEIFFILPSVSTATYTKSTTPR